MSEEKLYDLEAEDYPNEKVGTTFLIVQVFRCPVCLSRTNRMETRGGHYHQRKPYPVCPHREEDWHALLRAKLQKQSPAHPASYQAELASEIETLRQNTVDQLIGKPDLSTEEPFPATSLNIKDPKYD